MIKKRAKRYCIAAGCRNNDINSDHSFFHVPTNKKDADRVKKWLTLLGREDLLEKTELKRASHAVCGAHFEMSSIKTAIYLKHNAVPTMCLANQPHTFSSTAQPLAAPFKSNRRLVSGTAAEDDAAASTSAGPSTSSQRKDRGRAELLKKVAKTSIETQTDVPEPMPEQQAPPTEPSEKTISKRKLTSQLKEINRKQKKILSLLRTMVPEKKSQKHA